MERKKASDVARHGHIDRRSFLDGAGRFALGGLTAGAIFEIVRPNDAWARQVAKDNHPASARVLERLRTRFTFQISVDVATLEQGRAVAGCGPGGRGQHRRNGDAAAQERRRLERGAGLPASSFPRRSCWPT